jgi:glycosyltransferase involved in cell wall biosynthesis
MSTRLTLPRISVITPSFNQAEFLEQTLESVVSQGYPNLDYIVMDGGSTDGSVEIIQRYAKHLSFWTSEKDQGQSDAINRGFSRATGDIFCWINSDDYLEADSLMTAAAYFEEHKDWNVLNGGCRIVGQSERMPEVIGTVRRLECPGKTAVRRWSQFWFAQQSTFWRRSLWERVGPLKTDLHFVMDLELWSRFLALTEIHAVGEVLANYRLHLSAKCVADSASVALEILKLTATNLLDTRATRSISEIEAITELAWRQNNSWAELLEECDSPRYVLRDPFQPNPASSEAKAYNILLKLKNAFTRRRR